MLVALALGLPACGGDDPGEPTVLVIEDPSIPDARSIVTPGVLGLELGLEGSGLTTRVVSVDALDADDEAADGGVVVAVVAPFTDVPDRALAVLGAARIPVVSMSDLLAPAPSAGLVALRSIVPPLGVTAAAIAAPDCAAGDGSNWSDAFMAALGDVVTLQGEPAAAAAEAAERGCEVVVWSGDAADGADLAGLLARAAPSSSLTVAPRARTAAFAERVPVELTPLGICACVDLSTSTSMVAQGFLHRYQAANGLGVGPFAPEGFDAGRLLASAAGDDPSREALTATLRGIDRFVGLAGVYVWDEDGDLEDPVVRMYQRVGLRWLERPPARVAPETTRA